MWFFMLYTTCVRNRWRIMLLLKKVLASEKLLIFTRVDVYDTVIVVCNFTVISCRWHALVLADNFVYLINFSQFRCPDVWRIFQYTTWYATLTFITFLLWWSILWSSWLRILLRKICLWTQTQSKFIIAFVIHFAEPINWLCLRRFSSFSLFIRVMLWLKIFFIILDSVVSFYVIKNSWLDTFSNRCLFNFICYKIFIRIVFFCFLNDCQIRFETCCIFVTSRSILIQLTFRNFKDT